MIGTDYLNFFETHAVNISSESVNLLYDKYQIGDIFLHKSEGYSFIGKITNYYTSALGYPCLEFIKLKDFKGKFSQNRFAKASYIDNYNIILNNSSDRSIKLLYG